MQIVPAILTSDLNQLRKLLDRYQQAGFKQVDLDIQAQPFASSDTVAVAEAIGVASDFASLELGWDLKLAQPQAALAQLLDSHLAQMAVVYQSALIGFSLNLDCYESNITLGLLDTDLIDRDLDFYNRFPIIQVMTVAAEQQGGQIQQDLLAKTQQLRDLGFVGTIAIDGGVHPDSATTISKYPVDRVSVGSYFQNCVDAKALINAWEQLTQAFS